MTHKSPHHHTHDVSTQEEGMRLDRWLRLRYQGVPYVYFAKLCRQGLIRIDGRKVDGSVRIKTGQSILLKKQPQKHDTQKQPSPPYSLAPALKAQLRRAILYQDDDIIALNKKAGIATQGGTGVRWHIDGALSLFAPSDSENKPKLVHRLDQGTSGVLLIARHHKSAVALASMFREQTIEKTYWALCAGRVTGDKGRMETPIPYKERRPPHKTIGKDACTLYRHVRGQSAHCTWLILRPLSGRTHQIRQHCAWLGHPLLGDKKFGRRQKQEILSSKQPLKHPLKHLCLHARSMRFSHPMTSKKITITAEIPSLMKNIIEDTCGISEAYWRRIEEESDVVLRHLAYHINSKNM
ncbi:MAG: RluA family pseudouridine synthase [Alphaproteobacteria bacterium GM7ARS4]|nr:RluA family pseudouridine synthase [Alphaproteobacteria bacterium GM7ARS4]